MISSENRKETVTSDVNGLHARGGISYFYLILRNAPGLDYTAQIVEASLSFNALHISHSNFTNLKGTLGAALHIEKLSSDSLSLIVRIEDCNFTENAANAGSAVYASDSRFGASASSGSLTIHLVNVNAERNTISSGSTLKYDTSDFITGVFHTKNSHFIVNCTQHCNFVWNEPSVFYGHFASFIISGKALLMHNSGYYGAAFDLIDTILYIVNGSDLLFTHNHATLHGGAVDVHNAATNVQSQDICPIQFLGLTDPNPVFSLNELDRLNVNITFENNTAGNLYSLQSIYANVFYSCSWYPDTLTQYNFDMDVPPINGTRDAVYREVFHFIPTQRMDDHFYIAAGFPCPCDSDGTYNTVYCMTAGFYKTLELSVPIVLGRSFQFGLVGLDSVGSVGFVKSLYSDVYTTQATDGTLQLGDGQNSRSFFTTYKSCNLVEFTIYGLLSQPPQTGILSLSFVRGIDHEFYVNFSSCPVGFNYQKDKHIGRYSCDCGDFLKSKVKHEFSCGSETGTISRNNRQSWLSVNGDNIEHAKLCLPTYCNSNVSTFTLSDPNVSTLLCDRNHTGRACGACIEGYSRVFGSSTCKRCSNAWLATILLYGLLGVILVFVLFVLRLTVTVGAINGVIFFCNVMSINENLFFNEQKTFHFCECLFLLLTWI